MAIHSAQQKYKGRHISVYELKYELNGETYAKEMMSLTGTKDNPEALDTESIGENVNRVVCLVMNKRKSEILITQTLKPTANSNIMLCDLPSGTIMPGETEETAALRELEEQTGLTDTTVIKVLPAAYTLPSISDHKTSVVVMTASGEPKIQNLNGWFASPMWLEPKKINQLLLHSNCPPMSIHAQLILMMMSGTHIANL